MKKATAPAAPQDESMENILHSIRDIIADGGALTKEAPVPEEKIKMPPPDILELTEVVKSEEKSSKDSLPPVEDPLQNIDAALKQSSPPEKVQPAPETVFTPSPPPLPEPPAAPSPAPVVDPELISKKVAETSKARLQDFVNSIPKPKVDTMSFRSGHTVEDLVVEALKPMLAEWLDKNLPTIVDEIVQREIRKLLPEQ